MINKVSPGASSGTPAEPVDEDRDSTFGFTSIGRFFRAVWILVRHLSWYLGIRMLMRISQK